MNVQTQAQEIRVKSKIQSAEVYLSQASLKHQSNNFNLTKGHQVVIVEDIATSVIPNTIQISGKGNFVILSSQFQLNYITSKNVSKKIQQLEDTLEILQNKKSTLDIQIKTFDDEENMLLSNKSIGGQNTGVSVTELEKMANFYRNRLNDVRNKKAELLPKIKKLKEQIDNMQHQLNELNAQKNKPVGEIQVEIYANDNVNNAVLNVEYICNNAYWYPEYEIRVNDLKQPAQLLLKAQVVQNTGIDWNNIQLSLSTSAPNMSHNKPELMPWWLNYEYYPKTTYKSKGRFKEEQKQSVAYSEAPAVAGDEIAITKSAENAYEYTQSSEKSTTQQYQIQIPVNIPTNNKPARIDVQNQNIDARYTYYTAPKLSEYAYLIAQLTDWEKYNLMSAPLYIFIENSYIGQSEINADITKDTLQISLGIDKNISVKRQLVKKYNEKKIIGLNRKETRGYEIIVRNKKKYPTDIIIEDQIPLSSLQEIEVELLESSNANYDKTTGKLQWKLSLHSDEEKKIQFKFSVKYPKDKIINL
ncbi:MAG: hypothetical protein OHK0036_05370 [Bacteroidia bacterium]